MDYTKILYYVGDNRLEELDWKVVEGHAEVVEW
jgi:hypothetical protein